MHSEIFVDESNNHLWEDLLSDDIQLKFYTLKGPISSHI